MYMFIVFSLYMRIQLHSAKGINDVVLNKKIKFGLFCLKILVTFINHEKSSHP